MSVKEGLSNAESW